MNHSRPREILFQGPKQPVQAIVHEDMGKPFILEAAMLTKGGSGPSGLHDDKWRKILTSRSFRTASSELLNIFAPFVKDSA